MPTISFMAATPHDADELLRLYLAVYGASYPLALGTDRQTMLRMLDSANVIWMTARVGESIVGSAVAELDATYRIAKLEGVVVDPHHRKQNIAHRLVSVVTDAVFDREPRINSIFVTTRTLSVAPQMMCLSNGFIPLGILPNAHKLNAFETLTLMARYAPGALDRRMPLSNIPAAVAPVLDIAHAKLNIHAIQCRHLHPPPARENAARAFQIKPGTFEIIDAPHYVERHYHMAFPNARQRFYPFHSPNLLISALDGSVEVFAYLSKFDRSCILLSTKPGLGEVGERMPSLIDALANYGASYFETLVAASDAASIQILIDAQFVPSAAYPAMREIDGHLHDFIVMSRSMQPLNFRGMAIESSFKPYVDQFVNAWKHMYLDALEVFDDFK